MEKYFLNKLPNESLEEIRCKLAELLKYLSLCHHSLGDIPVSKEIDDIWHLWILQTQEYEELCKSLPGGKFIHHSSNDYPNHSEPINPEQEINRQVSFLVSYIINFGPFRERVLCFWPISQRIFLHFNKDIDKINGYLSELANNIL